MRLRFWGTRGSLPVALTWRDMRAFAGSLWVMGVWRRGRVAFWKYLATVLVRHPRKLPPAIQLTIHGYHYRNTPHGKPQWARPIYPDMNPENIDWKSFQGGAPEREFDANRYVNWRLYSDYSGGSVHENLSQQLAFWYKALGLRTPAAVTMTGAVLLWDDGREVPDTMNVAMEHSEGILFSWHSGFGNNQLGSGEDVLGTDGTISRSGRIRYTPQKVNLPAGKEMLGQTHTPPNAHVQNWLDCIRNGSEPNCPFELGYRVSVACRMAVDSYLQGRTVRWDEAAETIV